MKIILAFQKSVINDGRAIPISLAKEAYRNLEANNIATPILFEDNPQDIMSQFSSYGIATLHSNATQEKTLLLIANTFKAAGKNITANVYEVDIEMESSNTRDNNSETAWTVEVKIEP